MNKISFYFGRILAKWMEILNYLRLSNLRIFCDVPYRKNILIFVSKCGRNSCCFSILQPHAKYLKIEKVSIEIATYLHE